jgi:hypothetical protein
MGLFAHRLIGGSRGASDESSLEISGEKVRIKDSGVTEAKLGSALVAGLTVGAIAAKVLATTQLEALLTGGAQATAIAMNEGDLILDVILCVGTAAGEAATLDVGLDATALGATADPNGFMEAGNLNAVGNYRIMDSVTDATEQTYIGALLGPGPQVVDADGYITLISSADESSSSFVGQLIVLYIPA